MRLISAQHDMKLVGAIVSAGSDNVDRLVSPGIYAVGSDNIMAAVEDADVYVDLTSATAAERNLLKVRRNGLNYVIGTTGISQGSMDSFASNIKEDGSSAVVTPNFSVGVNVFWKGCEELARSLPGYEVEIIEIHHDQKKDAPSGTAKKAAEVISEQTGIDKIVYGREGMVGARGKEIGVHSLRLGDVVGEHTVIFAGNHERIELTHRAQSREAFAEGCILAIRWVAGRNDGTVHPMSEVLGL